MHKRGTSNSNARGNTASRRARKIFLLVKFGDGYSAPCSFCEIEVDFHTISVDRFPILGVDGGTYVRGNIRPACGPCNSRYGSLEMHLRRGHTLKVSI